MNNWPRSQSRFEALKQKVTTLLIICGLILTPPGSALSYANSASLDIDVDVHGIAMVKDLAATSGTSSGTINISWTEPDRNATTAPYSYIVHVSTTGEISDPTSFASSLPLSTFSNTPIPSPGPGGGNAGVTITGLTPGLTYCFAIEEKDSSVPPYIGTWERDTSKNWNVNNCATATTPIATPSNLTATAGLDEAYISWSALPSSATGASSLAYYDLYRSTQNGSGFISIATMTATSYIDYPLTPFNTYYYEVTAVIRGGLQSAPSPEVAAIPYTLPPMEPLGVIADINGSSITITWDRTTQFGDGVSFVSTTTPSPGELEGYQIFRSTIPCDPNVVLFSSQTYTNTSFSDDMGGNLYYYQVKSFNSLGVSTATSVISYSGDQSYYLDDCLSGVTLNADQVSQLNHAHNSYGGDVQISRSFLPQSSAEGVLRSAVFTPMVNNKAIPDFHFSSPVTVTLAYILDSGGQPTPADMSALSNYNAQDMGMYWDNGIQFNKLYGTINFLEHTVNVQTPNLGTFEIRSLYRTTSSPVFDISNVSSRIITPTSGGLNSVLIFTYDPGPNNVQVSGKIFDVRGDFIADMQNGPGGNQLQWNGHASNGEVVASGVYIYQIKGGGKIFNGTVVVAR